MKRILLIFIILLPVNSWSDGFIGWKKISTEHHTFIFEDYDENTAYELAGYSEEIYSIVTDFFDYYPSKITIYINSRIDSPNGMFYPIPGSINLYPVYPLNSENSTKSASWLYELLLHEMVHYVGLENQKGIFGGLSYIFGKDLAAVNGAFLPAWMIEGIAVFLESKYTSGGRGRNKYFEAFTKAAAIEEQYFNIYQLAYSSDFPPYNRIYSGGYILIKYLIDSYGEDIFQRIYNRYVKFPFFGPFASIKEETGKTTREIFEELKKIEMASYSTDQDILKSFPSNTISSDSYSNWTHPVKTDKGILAYRTDHEKKPAIVLFDDETGDEEIIVEALLMDGSSFNADKSGNSIVFTSGSYSNYHSYGYSLISNLYLHKNSKTHLLVENQSLFQPAISIDGNSIVAVQRMGSYSKLVSIDSETGRITDLYSREQTNIMNPAFSPTSDKIAFIVNDHGYQDIYIMERNNPDSARPLITIDMFSEYYPRFIDENQLSFISDRDNDLSLFSFDIEKLEMSLLFKDQVGIADAFIDSDNIIYSSYRTKGYELRKAKLTKETIFSFQESSETIPIKDIDNFEKTTYIDWTFPYLWLPKPDLKMSSTKGTQWGLGFAIFAGSYAQTGKYTFEFNYLPGLNQIHGSFDYNQKLGRTSLLYNISQSYNELYDGFNYYWKQQTEQTVSLIVPLYEKSTFNWRNVLQTYFSFKHILELIDLSSFTIADSFSMNSDNYLIGSTGIIFNGYDINYPRKAYFGDLAIYNQLGFSLLLPVFSATKTSYIIKESGSISIPLGPEGFNLKPLWEGAYHNNHASSSAVNARGWSPSTLISDFSLYYSLEYLMPLALLDWGFPLGFNIQNIAASIHFEGMNHFTFEEGSVRNEYYAGLKLMGTLGYNYGAVPAGAGINFRIYNDGTPFKPSEDIKIYFYLSTDNLF